MAILDTLLSQRYKYLQHTIHFSSLLDNIQFSRNFLPRGQADLGSSTALQRVRGGLPQLHPPTPCI